jgi:hypothetical protein
MFFFGHRSLIDEAQNSLLIIAAALFLFLTFGLYHGIRFRKETVDAPDFHRIVRNATWKGDFPDVPLDTAFSSFDGEGCLVALLVIVLTIAAMALLLWVVVPLLWVLFAFTVFAVYWVFYMALRQIFVLSKKCRRRLIKSMGYAATHTVLYTGWLFAIIVLAKWAIAIHGPTPS